MRGIFLVVIAAGLAGAPGARGESPAAVAQISQQQLLQRIESAPQSLLILDVRTPEEFAAGHIPGAINIPHDRLAERLAELPVKKDSDIVVYCRTGRRSQIALAWLRQQGYTRLLRLDGDYAGWQAAQEASRSQAL
ncbi:MAG: rhodanese-like domain-containing protein [Steroidobacteraceae bacterium]|nr:rhodanese-like domain-containing protein [Steroidobacteraceae bacterium]MDW8258037.1 rhodanese-like domain-containing protein [Gammaproteobacteria bacterium]